MKIRATILKVPRGHVSTYGAIARAAGLPGGARLVVRTLSQSHGLPWHRVVAAGGRIAIPGEGGLDQRFRLEMEGVKFSGKKVRMAEFEYKFPRKKTAKPKQTTKTAKSAGVKPKRRSVR
jgi:methylated-DNA-protein-cysteine methyltransferase-like protein